MGQAPGDPGTSAQLFGSILVVDDDAEFREICSRIVRQAGYASREAASGEEALDLARRQPPDVVVLDVRLRGQLSGHEVCRALKDEIRPEPAVIFISGARVESFDRAGGLLVGADDYLVKPFAADELLARIRTLLRRAHQGGPSDQLTKHERDVAELLKGGLGATEIAARLNITAAAARREIEQIFKKVGV
jgi:two-component system, OmpR family, response regulator